MELLVQYDRKRNRPLQLDGSTAADPLDETVPVEDQDNQDRTSHLDDVGDLAGDDVSLHSSRSDEDFAALDELINDNRVENTSDSNAVSELIHAEYCETIPVQELPPIDSELSKIVTSWLRVTPSREKVKDLFKECLLPSNVEGLHPVRLNQLLYDKLNFSYRVQDQRLRGINTYLARGLGPIISVWDSMLKHEAQQADLGSSKNWDVSKARKKLDKGIRLLCAGHSVVLEKRHSQLKPFFDPRYHYLLKPLNPVTRELLGDNVDQKIIEANKIAEAAQKLPLKCSYPSNSSVKPNYSSHYQRRGGSRSSRGDRRYNSYRDDKKGNLPKQARGRGNYRRSRSNYRGRSNYSARNPRK